MTPKPLRIGNAAHRFKTYVTPDYVSISDGEIAHFETFLRFLYEKYLEGSVLLTYRGEDFRNITRRLTNITVPDIEIYNRAFYFGDKARHYQSDVFNPDSRNFLTGINDSSESTIAYIFSRINNVVTSESNLRRLVSQKFSKFFSKNDNKEQFVLAINRCDSEEEKVKLRDYYLYFLHTAGSKGIRKEAFFVSTSSSKVVARGFARNRKLIFHYYIPQPYYCHAVAPWIIEEHQHIVNKRKLPIYQPFGLFANQTEVAVKGALFPQFLYGIELVEGNQLMVNPHILSLRKNQFKEAIKTGVTIDQSDFHNKIFQTGFIRWVQADENGHYEQHDLCHHMI
ncbi:MAG: hypothetical protein ACLQF0_11450 [Dissulfurispiraceae bacterium]